MEAATTTKGPSSDQLKALQTAIELIEREEGAGTIMKLDEAPKSLPSISTGSLPLDIALGIGGIPQGRVIEIFGPESSGKTTFCYHCIASVQAKGGIAAFVDAEHSMDVKYAQDCGVDIGGLVASQPDYGEQALKVVEKLIASGAVQLVVVDSVAALTPKAEIDGEIGDSFVGTQARMMSAALRKLAAEANRNNCTLIFTNQLREKIGVMFGSPETTPGGKALKFYCSVRLDIRRIETLKKGTDAYGSRVRVKVVKNKVAPPWRQAEFDVIYGRGFDRYGALIDLGVADKILTKSGSFFSYDREGDLVRLGQGKANAAEFLALPENKEMADEIDTKLRAIHLGEGHIEDVTTVVGANVEDAGELVDPLAEAAVEEAVAKAGAGASA
jgi:recombination protein RecA